MQQLVKKALFTVIVPFIHFLHGADLTKISGETYAEEIVIWHEILKNIKSDCSINEACAVLLKFEDAFNAPRADMSAPCASSDSASLSDPFIKPISAYVADIEEKLQKTKPVYVLCEIEEACALLLKQARRLHAKNGAAAIFSHRKASPSCLWPSMKKMEDNIRMLQDWHAVCLELNSSCTLIDAATIILMHQTKMIKKNRPDSALYALSHIALSDKYTYLSRTVRSVEPIQSYAYCLKYPLVTLLEKEQAELNSICPYKKEYEVHKQAKAACIKDESQYITDYRTYLGSKQMLLQGSYEIYAKSEMDELWRKIVLAGYPEQLISLLEHFQDRAGLPAKIRKMKNLYFLYGYPGGGKTSAAHLLAMILKRPLLEIRCPGIQTEYRASAVKNLETLLKPIFESFDPWIICLDEIDALQKADGRADQSSASQGRSNALSILQQLRDGSENPNVIIIGTSNYKDEIPLSILDRIGIGAYHVPLPGYEARKEIVKLLLEKKNILYSLDVLEIIATETGGMIPRSTTGFSSRGIFDVVYVMEMLIERANSHSKDLLASIPIATSAIAHQAVELVRDAFSSTGQPTTAEGRWLKEYTDSKHFWPTVNAAISLWNTGVSTVTGIYGMHISSEQLKIAQEGLKLQQTGDSRAMREEDRSSEHFSRERRAEYQREREEKRSAENLEISKEQLKISRAQLENSDIHLLGYAAEHIPNREEYPLYKSVAEHVRAPVIKRLTDYVPEENRPKDERGRCSIS